MHVHLRSLNTISMEQNDTFCIHVSINFFLYAEGSLVFQMASLNW